MKKLIAIFAMVGFLASASAVIAADEKAEGVTTAKAEKSEKKAEAAAPEAKEAKKEAKKEVKKEEKKEKAEEKAN